MRGAPSWWTDFGPPEKITPTGFLAAISSAVIVYGTISEYTCASRTRRAMSWAYCAPKSTTRTVSKDSVTAQTRRRERVGHGGGGVERSLRSETIKHGSWGLPS